MGSQSVITCRAAVAWRSREALKLEEIQVDPPKSTEVRIKVLYASLCGTDFLCYNGFPRRMQYGRIIESVGEEVTTLQELDTVMPHFIGECGECPNCKSGKANLCFKYPLSFTGLLLDGTSRMSINGRQRIYHHVSCFTLSEYRVLDSNYVVKVDPRLPLQHASFLCCSFTTGYGATWKVVDIEEGSTVAVLGLGGVGLGVVEGARQRGAAKIIGIDIHDKKQEKGKIFGVTDFINAKNSDKRVSELVKEATGGLGVDYFFECTDVPDLMIDEAIEATRKGFGTVILLGAGLRIDWQINYVPLMFGRTLKGSIYGGVRIRSDLPSIIDKCINKDIKLEELFSEEFSLHEVNEALDYLKNPDCVKILIKF